MKINKLKLISDLQKCLPGIADGNSIIEGADTFVFNEGHIHTYNSAISVDVKLSEDLPLKGLVKAVDFYNCITKLPKDEFELEIENDSWKITCDKIKVSMKLISTENIMERFSATEVDENNWIEIDGEDFNKALQICLMSKNTTSFSGVYVKDDIFISTDSWQINKYIAKNNYPLFWINNAAVTELLKWSNLEAMQLNKSWLQFKSVDGAVFSVRTLNSDKFPFERINTVLTGISNNTLLESEFSDEFYKAADRASGFSEESDGREVVEITLDKEVKVKSARISGAYEEVVDDMSCELDTPISMKLDINIIKESSKFFKKFKLLPTSSVIDGSAAIHVILENDEAIKMFSTIV